MTEPEIFDILVEHAKEVLPELREYTITRADSLLELGANSMDRADIIIMTLESLAAKMPLVDLAGAKNIGELVGIFHAKSAV